MKVGRFGAYVETDELIRKTVPKDMQAEDVTLDWAISNLPIFSYFPNDSRPVGLRRQRTKAKGWKAFIAHAGNKAEVSNDIKVKDIDDAMANSILDDFYKKEEKKAKKKNKT
jgi:topoisomerase IA-like protein